MLLNLLLLHGNHHVGQLQPFKSEVVFRFIQGTFQEDKLTLKRTLELSLAMEAAAESSKGFKSQDIEPVHRVEHSSSMRISHCPYYRCGRANHEPQHCRFREVHCHHCDKVRHIATVCRSSKKPVEEQPGWQKKWAGGCCSRQHLIAEDTSSESDDLRVNPSFMLRARTSKPIEV